MKKPLVLRVEIESLGEELAGLLSQPQAAVDDLELRRREAAVAAAETELQRNRDRVGHEAERLQAQSRKLAEREATVETGGAPTASQKLRQDRREQELEARLLEVSDREDRLDVREAEFEADVEIREDRLDRQRGELVALEQRLKRKEAELLVYVAQLQEEFVRHESSRWNAVSSFLRH